jgi:hypothetical protein
MTGKRKKLSMSFLLQVFWSDDVCVVEHALFPGCANLTALTCNSLADVQKFITLKLFMVSVSVNARWKDEKLLYICPIYALTLFQP